MLLSKLRTYSCPGCSAYDQPPVDDPGKAAEDGPGVCASITNVGDLDQVLGS